MLILFTLLFQNNPGKFAGELGGLDTLKVIFKSEMALENSFSLIALLLAPTEYLPL